MWQDAIRWRCCPGCVLQICYSRKAHNSGLVYTIYILYACRDAFFFISWGARLSTTSNVVFQKSPPPVKNYNLLVVLHRNEFYYICTYITTCLGLRKYSNVLPFPDTALPKITKPRQLDFLRNDSWSLLKEKYLCSQIENYCPDFLHLAYRISTPRV
jgi:hypothetical protein